MNFKAIFMPVFTVIPTIAPPTSRVAGAFTALNKLFGAETHFAEVVVALRTALDRAAGASAAGNQLWLGRQGDASANYALEAAALLQGFSSLRAAVVKAFAADGLSLSLSPRQFSQAKAALAHGIPSSITSLLRTAAAAVQPQSSSEVKAFTSLLLSTKALQRGIAAATPSALKLPAVLGSRSLTSADDALAAALSSYANYVLESAGKTYHPAYRVA